MQAWRVALFALLLAGLPVLPGAAGASPLFELPEHPQIDRVALERYAARTLRLRESQARGAGEFGCLRYCAMLERAFARIAAAAREQGEPAGGQLQWQLVVTRTRGEAALSLPGGHIVVSEDMIAELGLSEAELAFIIAHEAAHVLLQHEAEVLDYLQASLLPRGLHRSVWDLYAELDYNTAALLRLQGLMQQGELEADFAGLLLGAQAGYDPAAMRSALAKIAAGEQQRSGIVRTHPAMARRLTQIEGAMPMARRLQELTAARQ